MPALAFAAAGPKLPPLSGKVNALGLEWEVLDAAEWAVEGSGDSQILHLKKARPQAANPRSPIQYALAVTPPRAKFTLEVEVKPEGSDAKNIGSAIIVYAWRDNLHFDYVHLSPDTGKEQPVHNGIFHVYGGDRVRISPETGARVFTSTDWIPVRVVYDAEKNLVETWVRGEKNASLRGIDLSLGAGRIGLGSFFNTASFRKFRIT